MGAVDEYFDSLEPSARDAFERVRRLVMELVPDAEQGTSYGMAALRYRTRPLIGFRAAKNHLGVYPFSPEAVDAVRDHVASSQVSKGTVRFTADTPLTDDAVRALVRARLGEIAPA